VIKLKYFNGNKLYFDEGISLTNSAQEAFCLTLGCNVLNLCASLNPVSRCISRFLLKTHLHSQMILERFPRDVIEKNIKLCFLNNPQKRFVGREMEK